MAQQAILEFISQQRQLGEPDNVIREALFKNGWNIEKINEAFAPAPVHPINGTSTSNAPSASDAKKVDKPQLIPVSQVFPISAQPTLTPTALDLSSISSATPETSPSLNIYTPTNSSGGFPWKIVLSVLTVLLVFISIGGYFAYGFYQTLPEVVLQKMFFKTSQVKTITYIVTAELHANLDYFEEAAADSEVVQPINLPAGESVTTFLLSTTSDLTNQAHPKADANFSISTTGLTGQKESLAFQAKIIDKLYYFNISELPDEVATLVPPQLVNQWIKVSSAELENNSDSTPPASSPTPLSEKDTQKLAKIWQDAKVFSITKRHTNERIHDIETFHYSFKLNEAGLKKALLASYPVLAKEQFSAKDQAEFADGIDEMLQAVEFTDGEIWVGTQDFYPYQLEFIVHIADPESKQNIGYMNFSLAMKDFNKPVIIIEPPTTRALEEIFMELNSAQMPP